MYELVLDPKGDYRSLSGNFYLGSFTIDALSSRDQADLREAAQNLVEFHFLHNGIVVNKVISKITGSDGLETVVFEKSETN